MSGLVRVCLGLLLAMLAGAEVANADGSKAVARLSQLAGRSNLNYQDREIWRRILRWPVACENKFNYPDHEFGGIRFYSLGDNAYLAQVTCTLGAYQGSQMFFWLHQLFTGGPIRTRPLIFEVLREVDQLQRLRLSSTREPWGTAEFAPHTRRLQLLDRFRAFGDCGIWSSYAVAGARIVLVAARAKLVCDGRQPNQPQLWPKVEPKSVSHASHNQPATPTRSTAGD